MMIQTTNKFSWIAYRTEPLSSPASHLLHKTDLKAHKLEPIPSQYPISSEKTVFQVEGGGSL